MTNVRDWNPVLIVASTYSCSLILIQLAVASVYEKELLYKEVPSILENKLFWPTIILNVFLMMLPYMLYRRFTQLIFYKIKF